MQFHKLIKEYEDLYIVRGCTKRTIKANKRVITRFWRYLKGISITFNQLTIKTIVDYVDFLKVKYSHNYVYLQIIIIRGFLRFLYSHRYIESNYISQYTFIRPKKDLPKNLPLEKDIDNILKLPLSLLERSVIELYYACGIRLTELINLNIKDIDFDNNLIFIRQGKGKKDRVVPTTDHSLSLVKDYINKRKGTENQALFLSRTGNRITSTVVRRIFNLAKNAYNQKVTPHILRHSFATHMLKNGANIRDISEILGHEELSTTQRYTKVDISDLKRVIKRFHPRENEIYKNENIIPPKNLFFSRKRKK